MGIVLDMIGQGGDKLGVKSNKNTPKDKKIGEEAKEVAPGTDQTVEKEGEFAVRKSKSERFRMSMRRQPQHKGKPSMGGPRVRKAR